MNLEERYIIGKKVSIITIAANIILSLIKFLAGTLGKSSAMIADSIHSLSDVLSTIVVIVALKLSKKPEDKEHPYGHEKIEPIMSKILASILFVTAILLGYNAVKHIISGNVLIPGRIAVYAAIISIVTKEWMYRYTIKYSNLINSTSLKADAWHHRSDAFSSIGTLVGIIGARLGIRILDPLASIVICIFISKIAIDIYIQAINQLVDKCADDKILIRIKNDILNIKGVLNIDDLKTRMHADKIYVDVEISVDKELNICEAHEIAENVEKNIEFNIKNVKHCMVHVNPYNKFIR